VGLRRAGRLTLEAGADCVMPATFRYHELGGNAISRDPRRGVVDETLKVHGTENLHVLDASVFPTAITVNPQLTVMALAHYGAEQID
jgi:choline dehydrogenase-like flavoprotein